MAKYVDTESKRFPTKYTHNDTDYAKGWNDCLNSIEQQKTSDVQEVRHAHWIDIWFDVYTHYEQCSECGWMDFCEYGVKRDLLDYDYCPGCGAKMDGVCEPK